MTFRFLGVWGIVVGLSLVSENVRAQSLSSDRNSVGLPLPPPAAGQDLPPLQVQRWYGWQPMILDATAVASIAIATQIPANPHTFEPAADFVLAGTGLYAFGAPITHLANKQPTRAAVSFLMRASLPVLTGGVSFAATGDGGKPMLLAVGGGMLTAMLLDDLLLARKTETVPRKSNKLAPALAWDGARGATAGVAGTF